jgi:tetratricopeptide (TPR) repeat protein
LNNISEIEEQILKIKSELKQGQDNAELLNDLGVGYYLLGQYSNAIIQLKKATRIDFSRVQYHFNLANAYSENDQPEQAIESYLQALDIDPAHIASLNNLADCYEQTGENKKAHELFHYQIKIEPDNPLSHFNLGNFFLRQNQHIEAVKCYEEALKRDKNFIDAYFNIGWVLYMAKAFEKSLEYVEKGINIDSGHEELKKLKKDLLNLIN